MSTVLWERQTRSKETGRAWAAFCCYRDLGRGRSLLKAWRQWQEQRRQKGYERATDICATVPGRWVHWSRVHAWSERAVAYDAHLELLVREHDEAAHAAALAAFRERNRRAAVLTAEIALAVLSRLAARLQSLRPEEITPGTIPAWLRAGAAVLETSLNAEAEVIGVRELERLLDLERADDTLPVRNEKDCLGSEARARA